MKSKHLVSILMPAYNAEKFIAEAIGSILNQDYKNWELLILDDASTDSTLGIINSFKDERIKAFRHKENLGYLLSCNQLFESTKGSFITFLDADDVCSSERLSLCLSEFEKDAELDFITTDHSRFAPFDKSNSEHSVEVDYKLYATDPTYNPTLCCATIFLKKELLNTVGGYRALFKKIGGEDYFWLWELSRFGKGKHLNKSLYDYRFHPNQTSKLHNDELYLFVPELIETLRTEFKNSPWNVKRAAVLEQTVREQFVNSDYHLNLRKAQFSLNGDQRNFLNYVVTCLKNVRDLNQIRPIIYLLYSWFIRKDLNANQ